MAQCCREMYRVVEDSKRELCEVEDKKREMCGVKGGISRSSALHGVNAASLLTYRLDTKNLSQHSGEPEVVENDRENSRI